MSRELPAIFSRYRQDIEAALKDALPEDSPDLLYRMMRYHMGWVDYEGNPTGELSGKAVRPALCLLACEAVGGSLNLALPAAAALELVHNFSLIHDDIQDGDTERRHHPTVWSLWGVPQAINAGDGMLVIAHLALARLTEGGLDSRRAVSAFQIINQGCLRMIEGQCLDLSFEESLEISVDDYLTMIARKTGALFEASLRLGALTGGAGNDTVERFGRIGAHLGRVFQIRDDILGIWGTSDATGKPVAADIRRKKKSLPVVHALSAANGTTRHRLMEIYSRDIIDDDAAAEVTEQLNQIDSYDFCQRMVEEAVRQALNELDSVANHLQQPAFRAEIKEVCAFLSGRQF